MVMSCRPHLWKAMNSSPAAVAFQTPPRLGSRFTVRTGHRFGAHGHLDGISLQVMTLNHQNRFFLKVKFMVDVYGWKLFWYYGWNCLSSDFQMWILLMCMAWFLESRQLGLWKTNFKHGSLCPPHNPGLIVPSLPKKLLGLGMVGNWILYKRFGFVFVCKTNSFFSNVFAKENILVRSYSQTLSCKNNVNIAYIRYWKKKKNIDGFLELFLQKKHWCFYIDVCSGTSNIWCQVREKKVRPKVPPCLFFHRQGLLQILGTDKTDSEPCEPQRGVISVSSLCVLFFEAIYMFISQKQTQFYDILCI